MDASTKTTPRKHVRGQRLSREAWLEQALEVLARDGNAKLRVETIAAALGVTTGSFYWHFKDRDTFLESLVRYWEATMTGAAVDQISSVGGRPEDRLKALMAFVLGNDLARYDISIRALAAQEAQVRPIVTTVDGRRMAFIRSLFEPMGFTGDALEMRVRAVLAYLSLDPIIRQQSGSERRLEMLDAFHRMITALPPADCKGSLSCGDT